MDEMLKTLTIIQNPYNLPSPRPSCPLVMRSFGRLLNFENQLSGLRDLQTR